MDSHIINFKKVIENDSELEFYHEVTGNILNYIRNNGQASFSEIIRRVQGNDRRTLRLLDQMVSLRMVAFSNGKFSLTDYKKKFLKGSELECGKCGGGMVDISKLHKIDSIMMKIYSEKPKPTFIFNQRPVNRETTIRRVAYMLWRGDIQDKRIAFLGDDDLTSIPLALLGVAKEVVVFDIDRRLTNFIKAKSRELKIKIKVINRDITLDVPKKYKNHFDVFISDPTPTKIPFTVFTNLGLSILKEGEGKIGYLSMYPSCMKKNIDLQKNISAMSLIITDIIPFFTEYDFVEETYSEEDMFLLRKYSGQRPQLSFYESLVRVETTRETKSLEIKYELDDMLGSATRRVLGRPELDPALQSGNGSERSYITKVANEIANSSNEGGPHE